MKCVPAFSELFYGYDISGVNPEEAVGIYAGFFDSSFQRHCAITSVGTLV